MSQRREVELEVRGVTARAALLDELAPAACDVLWSSLPIDATLMQSRWSGETTYAVVPSLRRPEIALENPATFMCPGTIHIGLTKGNLGLPYGQAQSRDLGGDNTWGAHVATLRGDPEPFLAVLRSVATDGATELRVRQAGTHAE